MISRAECAGLIEGVTVKSEIERRAQDFPR